MSRIFNKLRAVGVGLQSLSFFKIGTSAGRLKRALSFRNLVHIEHVRSPVIRAATAKAAPGVVRNRDAEALAKLGRRSARPDSQMSALDVQRQSDRTWYGIILRLALTDLSLGVDRLLLRSNHPEVSLRRGRWGRGCGGGGASPTFLFAAREIQ